MNSSLYRYFLGIVILLSLLFSLTLSQAQREADILALINKNATWDYTEFALNKIKSNRIFMLADEEHGSDLYMKTVIDILWKWVKIYEIDPNKYALSNYPKTLFLVLERDSIAGNSIRKYFASGNLIDAIDPHQIVDNTFSNAVLEFDSDLHSLHMHIDSLNRYQPATSQLQYDIYCPEKTIYYTDWSKEKSEQYFTYERDEYSSAKVIKLLEDHPTAHALIFYGGQHLFLGQQPKPPQNPIGKGYYLAHYLRKHFPRQGGVYICDQVSIPLNKFRLDNAFNRIDHSFGIEDSCWQDIPFAKGTGLPHFDATIFHVAQPQSPCRLYHLLSETMIDLILQHIDECKNTKNELQQSHLLVWLSYLSIFTDKDYATIDRSDSNIVQLAISEIKQWRKSTKFDVVKDIIDLSVWKRVVDRIRFYPNPLSLWYQKLLSECIGFSVWYPYEASSQVRADATWKYIQRYRKYITIDHLISVLWIGTSQEKEKALRALEQESGQSYQTPKEWAEWFSNANI